MLKEDILKEAKIIADEYPKLLKNSIQQTRSIYRLEMLKNLAEKYYQDKALVQKLEGVFILIGEDRPPFVLSRSKNSIPIWHIEPFFGSEDKNPVEKMVDRMIRRLARW